MDILRQSLQKQNLNIMQTTCSTIYSTTPSTIPSDSPECQKVQTPAWVAQNKTTGEKFNSTTKQTELQDIVSKEMIRKFEKINKAFNSYKPLLSKVLTKARETAQLKLTVPILRNGKFGQLSFQRSTFYQRTSFI